MQAAVTPTQRPSDARLLVVSGDGTLVHAPRAALADYLRPGDLLVANDAATLPASLRGVHVRTGAEIEIRLGGRGSLAPDDVRDWTAVAFGAGDYRIRTEDRPLPPELCPGDRLTLGPLDATVMGRLGHPRLIAVRFAGTPDVIWDGIARHGRPIQYAHVPAPLALWDVWTAVAALPVAFEPPSAGFVLDWRLLDRLRTRGVAFATLTHAAGISSTGDPVLDAMLPLDEPYHIPENTVRAIGSARARGGRVIALGTTVTRALEHAWGTISPSSPSLPSFSGVATQRIGPETTLRVVDAILSGAHEPGSSHYELLRAFASDAVVQRMSGELEQGGYRSHEFGDSVLIEALRRAQPSSAKIVWRSMVRGASALEVAIVDARGATGYLDRKPPARDCGPWCARLVRGWPDPDIGIELSEPYPPAARPSDRPVGRQDLLPNPTRPRQHSHGILPAVGSVGPLHAAVISQQRRHGRAGAAQIPGENPGAMADVALDLHQVIRLAPHPPRVHGHDLHEPLRAHGALGRRRECGVLRDHHRGDQRRRHVLALGLQRDRLGHPADQDPVITETGEVALERFPGLPCREAILGERAVQRCGSESGSGGGRSSGD